MSATSVTLRDKENVYHDLENELIKQGDKYLLMKGFRLGSGVEQEKVDFLMQYTALLCNTNCDVNSLIEQRIKGLEQIDCKTRVSFETELTRLSEQYYDWLNEGNSGNFLEYILSEANLQTCVSWTQTAW
jgi:hypothetical protein